jgi:hypothetical protein
MTSLLLVLVVDESVERCVGLTISLGERVFLV